MTLDNSLHDFFTYNEIFGERDGMTERDTKRDERDEKQAERDATQTIPLTRSKTLYNRF